MPTERKPKLPSQFVSWARGKYGPPGDGSDPPLSHEDLLDAYRAGVEAMREASIEVAEGVGTSNFAKVHRLSVNVAARKLTGDDET